jgi:FkbM family methyltransferase
MNELTSEIQWFGWGLRAQMIVSLTRWWPFQRGKSGVLRILTRWCCQGRLPLRHLQGAQLRVDVTEYIGQILAQTGAFEPKTLTLACTLMKDGGWFVDAGCNFGIYTCVVGTIPGCRVLAIDPSPKALAQLEQNLALNTDVDCVRMYAALTTDARIVRLEVPSLNLGSTNIKNLASGGADQKILCCGIPASQALEAAHCSPVQLLKIDIERGELSALRGWDWSENGRPRNILCEHLNAEMEDVEAKMLIDFLISKNYQPFTVNGLPWNNFQPLPECNLWWRG